MSRTDQAQALAALLADIHSQHNQAFPASAGYDPDWPIWYAERLVRPLNDILASHLSRSQIVFCLMVADQEHQTLDPDGDRARSFAEHFVERYASADNPEQDRLSLYYYQTCGFSRRVLRALERLDVEVQLRNIFADAQHREALIEARGRPTVPVLRIDSPDGAVRWMPESLDIIRYLETYYGPSTADPG